jgi:NAD(P)H-quinone oxidoreductase subunit 6
MSGRDLWGGGRNSRNLSVKRQAMPGVGTFVFYGLAALVVGGAAGVAFSRNILHAAFLLLATLAGTAGLYLYLGADFVGVTQLLIYVGGILVLLLFAVLLTNRIGDVQVTNQALGRGKAIPIAMLVGLLIIVAVAVTSWPRTEAVSAPTTARLGDAFLREYLLPFELASLVLLMALVGAMMIARRAVRDIREAGVDEGLGNQNETQPGAARVLR